MYAIFRSGGRQFRAEKGKKVRLPTIKAEPGDSVTFDEVLLGGDDDSITVGAPLLDGAKVSAEVVSHGKGDKIRIFKHKRRKNYRRKMGHRQGFTEVRIDEISLK